MGLDMNESAQKFKIESKLINGEMERSFTATKSISKGDIILKLPVNKLITSESTLQVLQKSNYPASCIPIKVRRDRDGVKEGLAESWTESWSKSTAIYLSTL